MTIEELRKRESEALSELQSIREEIRKAKLAEARDKYGVSIGSVVVNNKGKRHRVTHIDTSWKGRPWVSGNPERKDGSFGTVVRNLFNDWKAGA